MRIKRILVVEDDLEVDDRYRLGLELDGFPEAIDYLIKTHTTPARVAHSVPTWVATQPARPMSLPIGAVAQAVATGANGSGV